MITIPAFIRKLYHLNDGDRVVMIEDEGTLRLIPIVPEESLLEHSCSAEEMISMLQKSREEEMELENR
jgi:bifunctional DNA-binding transcriptional regulator/antitoxin component of YhaV-PrlF toxin-antitoxin module